LLVSFAFTPEKKQQQNTRNKSGRAKHCRTPHQKTMTRLSGAMM
jgi:hypothetical protein